MSLGTWFRKKLDDSTQALLGLWSVIGDRMAHVFSIDQLSVLDDYIFHPNDSFTKISALGLSGCLIGYSISILLLSSL